MTNYSIVKKIDKLINENDIVLFLGKSICSVAFNFDRDNYIYINNDFINFSFIIGIINNLDCRVFVVCDGDYVIKYFNSFIELKKYCRQRQLFVFVLRDKICDNVFNCMIHPQASFFNIGFRSYKATPYFRTMEECAKLKIFMESSIQASIFMVDFDSDVFDKYTLTIPEGYSIKDKIVSFKNSLDKED